jgi:hypothetical protein
MTERHGVANCTCWYDIESNLHMKECPVHKDLILPIAAPEREDRERAHKLLQALEEVDSLTAKDKRIGNWATRRDILAAEFASIEQKTRLDEAQWWYDYHWGKSQSGKLGIERLQEVDERIAFLKLGAAPTTDRGAGAPAQQDSGKRVDEVKSSSRVDEHGSAKTLPELKYSCGICGRYMDKPCEHWAAWIANPQPTQPAAPAQPLEQRGLLREPDTINLLKYLDPLALRLRALGISDPWYVASNAISILQEICPPKAALAVAPQSKEAELRALVTKWRKFMDQREPEEITALYTHGFVIAKRGCADELEAALALPPTDSEALESRSAQQSPIRTCEHCGCVLREDEEKICKAFCRT